MAFIEPNHNMSGTKPRKKNTAISFHQWSHLGSKNIWGKWPCHIFMMRIVCPNCGDEPQKGQRHICRPSVPVAPEDAPTLGGSDVKVSSMLVRRAPCATAGSMCASMASLASKNPGLWKSKRSLARCGGEDFVAALIFMAAGHDSWSKTPKRALLLAFHGVATEAARALQRFWRCRQRQRRTAAVAATTAAVVGYTAKASTYHGSFGERRSGNPAAPTRSVRALDRQPDTCGTQWTEEVESSTHAESSGSAWASQVVWNLREIRYFLVRFC